MKSWGLYAHIASGWMLVPMISMVISGLPRDGHKVQKLPGHCLECHGKSMENPSITSVSKVLRKSLGGYLMISAAPKEYTVSAQTRLKSGTNPICPICFRPPQPVAPRSHPTSQTWNVSDAELRGPVPLQHSWITVLAATNGRNLQANISGILFANLVQTDQTGEYLSWN